MKKYIIHIVLTCLCFGILNAQNFDRDALPTPGPTPKINIAIPRTFKLSNGLTVMVVENHKLPKVDISLSADQRPICEGEIVGVGQIMADQLGNGTTSMSKKEFNKKVDFLGAKLNFNSSGASANTLSKYFEEVMQLMTDAILNPLFSAEEVEDSKNRTIERLKVGEKSAKNISKNVYPALVYGKNTARGEFAAKANIQNITLEDVKAYYKKYFSPENYYLVIVGDVTVKQVKKMLKKGLSKWEKTSDNSFPPLTPAQNLPKPAINIVDVPNAVQAVIKVGNLTTLRQKSEDFFAATIANYILGGGSLESRLNMNLREKNAFTYGAYSSLSTSKYSPEFSITTNVRNAVVPEAVKEIMVELKKIPTITAKELENAKARLKGSFIMALEHSSTIATFAVNKMINELPDNFYSDYLQAIDKVTIEDVKIAADKIIKPEHTRIFIAGKASEFASELEKLGYEISYFDKDATPTAAPAKQQLDSNVTGASVAARYIAAIGGKEAVQKINSIKMIATAKIQNMEMQLTSITANGAKSMIDMSVMGNSVNKVVFNGKDGYMQTQGQKLPIPEEAKKIKLKMQHVFQEIGYEGDQKIKVDGIENIKGEDTYAIKQGNVTYYYSVATGLKTAEIATQKVPSGQTISIPTYYSDYKEVNGVKVPYKMSQELMGKEIVFLVNSYEFNTAKDEDFK